MPLPRGMLKSRRGWLIGILVGVCLDSAVLICGVAKADGAVAEGYGLVSSRGTVKKDVKDC